MHSWFGAVEAAVRSFRLASDPYVAGDHQAVSGLQAGAAVNIDTPYEYNGPRNEVPALRADQPVRACVDKVNRPFEQPSRGSNRSTDRGDGCAEQEGVRNPELGAEGWGRLNG